MCRRFSIWSSWAVMDAARAPVTWVSFSRLVSMRSSLALVAMGAGVSFLEFISVAWIFDCRKRILCKLIKRSRPKHKKTARPPAEWGPGLREETDCFPQRKFVNADDRPH